MRTTAAMTLALGLSSGCAGGERTGGGGDGGSLGTETGAQSGAAGIAAGGSDGGGGGLSGLGGVGSGTGGTFAGTSGRAGASGSGGVGGSDACATAVEVEFTDGYFTFTGDTSTGVDEFPDLTCDSAQVAMSLYERQIYFRLQAAALRTYRFQLEPSFYGFVYVFPMAAACDGAAIQEACSSAGETGMISRVVNPRQTGTSVFQPAFGGTYFFAVDSDTSAGSFEITVTED